MWSLRGGGIDVALFYDVSALVLSTWHECIQAMSRFTFAGLTAETKVAARGKKKGPEGSYPSLYR